MNMRNPTFQCVPDLDKPGEWMIYVGYNTWENDLCTRHEELFAKKIKNVHIGDTGKLAIAELAADMADIFYHEISKYLSNETTRIINANARERLASETLSQDM